jgi:hypothetical protein
MYSVYSSKIRFGKFNLNWYFLQKTIALVIHLANILIVGKYTLCYTCNCEAVDEILSVSNNVVIMSVL